MNQKCLKWILLAATLCCFELSLKAQVFSQNIVGYYLLPIYAGDNYVANQFTNTDVSLNYIFTNGTPQGSSLIKWDIASGQYLPVSTYDTNSGWSINYTLSLGEGAIFHSPTLFTNVFSGTVWPGLDLFGPFVPPVVQNGGLLSCVVPFTNATFFDVIGRDPLTGESVTLLDALTQSSTTTTFDGESWNNGDPLLGIGQSAFYNLNSPDPVPEPNPCALLGVGTVLFAALRKRRK